MKFQDRSKFYRDKHRCGYSEIKPRKYKIEITAEIEI